METGGLLIGNSSSKVKNIEGKLVGKDGQPLKQYRRVQFGVPVEERAPHVTQKSRKNYQEDEIVQGANVAIPLVLVEEVSSRFANTLYGYFIGKRLAFPIVEIYVKYAWAKYGIERVMLNHGFFFQFSTKEGMDKVSNDGFVEVTRKHGKGKQNSKSWHIDGVRLTKPKPNYYYRPVSKPVNVNGEAATSQPNVNKERSTPKPNNKGKDVSNLQEIIVSLQTSFDTLMEKDKNFEVNNETWKASNDVESILDDSDSGEVKNVFVEDNGKHMDDLVDDAKKVEAHLRNDDMGQAAEESSHENAYSVDGFHTVIDIFCESIYVCFIGCVAFALSDDESFSDEDVPKEIYLNPLFDEEIISTKIDPHHFNAESDLIESLLNRDSLIISSPKFDSLLEEFSGELAHIDLILPGINEADFDPKEEIRLVKKLLYDNSSHRPPEESNSENSDDIIESFSPSPIPVEDSDSLMEEIDLFLTPDDSMPPGIENDDYDSEGDILFLEELLSNDSPSLPINESFHCDVPSSPRPHAKPPDDDEIEPDTGVLTAKVVGDISELYVHMPNVLTTLPTLS
ncbi:hypothetical protein Tco_1205970, partial [Tanacetum coccineum]